MCSTHVTCHVMPNYYIHVGPALARVQGGKGDMCELSMGLEVTWTVHKFCGSSLITDEIIKYMCYNELLVRRIW